MRLLAGTRVPKRFSGLVAMLLVIGFSTLALTPPAIDSIDARFRLQAADGMNAGTTTVERDPDWPGYFVTGPDGNHRTIYGIGQILLLMPVSALSAVLVGGAGDAAHEGVVVWVYVTLIATLIALGCWSVLRALGFPSLAAAKMTGLFYFATPCVIWARSMQEEGLLGGLLLSGIALSLHANRCRSHVLLACAGLVAGLAVSVRPYSAIPIALILIWLLVFWSVGRLRAIASLVLGVSPLILLTLGWNALRSGNPLQWGWHATGGWSFSLDLLAYQTVSLDAGVLWFAPMVALPLVALILRGRLAHRRCRAALISGLLLAGLGVTLVMLAGLPQYVGWRVGVAWGPRYPAHILIVITPFAVVAWRMLRRRKGVVRLVCSLLICVALAVQVFGLWFHPNLEEQSAAYFERHALQASQPRSLLLRRVKHVGLFLNGQLESEAFPNATGEEAVDARILTTPEVTPYRIQASRRAGGSSDRIRYVVNVFWAITVLAASTSAYFLFRPRKSR